MLKHWVCTSHVRWLLTLSHCNGIAGSNQHFTLETGGYEYTGFITFFNTPGAVQRGFLLELEDAHYRKPHTLRTPLPYTLHPIGAITVNSTPQLYTLSPADPTLFLTGNPVRLDKTEEVAWLSHIRGKGLV